ncbi:MAG: hypothetical protein ACOYYU_16005 [Chloroflexota bacterium]
MVAKIGKQPAESAAQPERKLPWAGIAAGLIAGALVGFFLARLFLVKPATIIDSMDATKGWIPYASADNMLSVETVDGMKKQAVLVIFYVRQGGYVGISKPIDTTLFDNTKELQLSYRGNGAANTFEVKLLTTPNAEGKSAVFSYEIPHGSDTQGWVALNIPYAKFKCWESTGCRKDEIISPSQIYRIDFAISCKGNDEPGVGTVTIDQITAK